MYLNVACSSSVLLHYTMNVADEVATVAQEFLRGSAPQLRKPALSQFLTGGNGCYDHSFVCWALKKASVARTINGILVQKKGMQTSM